MRNTKIQGQHIISSKVTDRTIVASREGELHAMPEN